MKKSNKNRLEQKIFQALLEEKFYSFRPDPTFKMNLLEGLLEQPRTGFFEIFRRFSFAASSSFAILVFSATSTYAYVSPHVNAESALYPVKQFIEEVELGLATSEEDKIEKHIKFAERRFEEIRVLAESDVVDKKTIEAAHNSWASAEAIAVDIGDAKFVEEIKEKMAEQQKRIFDLTGSEVIKDVPEETIVEDKIEEKEVETVTPKAKEPQSVTKKKSFVPEKKYIPVVITPQTQKVESEKADVSNTTMELEGSENTEDTTTEKPESSASGTEAADDSTNEQVAPVDPISLPEGVNILDYEQEM